MIVGLDGRVVSKQIMTITAMIAREIFTQSFVFCFTNKQTTLYYIQNNMLFGNVEHGLSDRSHTPKTYNSYLSIFLGRQ